MKKIFAIVAVSIICLTGHTQDKLKDEYTKKVTSETQESSSNSGFISFKNFTKLNATNNGTTADANVAYSYQSWNFNATVSTPVTSKTVQVKPISLNGISNNASFTLGFQHIVWGTEVHYNQDAYNSAVRLVGKDPNNFTSDSLSTDEFWKFLKAAKIDWGTAFYFGGKLSLEQQSFRYLTDTLSFHQKSSSKGAVKLSIQLGLMPQFGIFALSYTYQSGYKADDASKYYFPVNGTPVQIEKELSLGVPQHQTTGKLRLEFLSNGRSKLPIRINPNFNLAFKDKVFSLEVPVYFLTDDKKGFTGGIYTGYLSSANYKMDFKKDNLGLGVFIGADFNDLFH